MKVQLYLALCRIIFCLKIKFSTTFLYLQCPTYRRSLKFQIKYSCFFYVGCQGRREAVIRYKWKTCRGSACDIIASAPLPGDSRDKLTLFSKAAVTETLSLRLIQKKRTTNCDTPLFQLITQLHLSRSFNVNGFSEEIRKIYVHNNNKYHRHTHDFTFILEKYLGILKPW